MPAFRYVAVDASGQRFTGEMVEADSRSVVERLRQLDRFPAEIVPVTGGQRSGCRPGNCRIYRVCPFVIPSYPIWVERRFESRPDRLQPSVVQPGERRLAAPAQFQCAHRTY